MALEARVLAQAIGYPGEGGIIGAPPVFYFEPHQPEMSGFKPAVLLDITEVWDTKRKAMECLGASSTCGTTTPTSPSAEGCSSSETRAPTWGWPQDHGRGVHAALPADREGARLMPGVIVTNPPKAEKKDVEALSGYGTATVGEAMGRTGFLGTHLRPIQQGVRVAGTAVTVLCWPGDNLMIHAAVEQCGEGDILVVTTTSPCTDGLFGELFATALVHRGVRASS